ncbi:MAG: hypothetical protein ACREHD_03550 [Pirellulales bacterium]
MMQLTRDAEIAPYPSEPLLPQGETAADHHLRCPLTTRDIGSVLARLMGPHWPHFHIDHLWYFNRATLTALVENSGFEVLAWQCAPKVFNVAYIAGLFEHNCRSAWFRRPANASLRFLPIRLLALPLPAVREGQLILARRPLC